MTPFSTPGPADGGHGRVAAALLPATRGQPIVGFPAGRAGGYQRAARVVIRAQRNPALADPPTLIELTIQGFEVVGCYGVPRP